MKGEGIDLTEAQAVSDVAARLAPLSRALDQSEQVKGKVEECAAELSSVNALLKEEVTDGASLHDVERALDLSEAVEVKVQECAEDLATVNDSLAVGIDERSSLEHKLAKSTAALSQSRAAERKSRHLALHDAVTGLSNAILFTESLEHGISQAKRHAWRLAVMFIDLDEFKCVNDTHGHHVGDRVLQVVGQRLRALGRGGDTVSRRGGDEFLFLMLEARDQANAEVLAARISKTVAEPMEIEGLTLTVGSSIGIALYPEDGLSVEELLKKADVAMYAVKRQKIEASMSAKVRLP